MARNQFGQNSGSGQQTGHQPGNQSGNQSDSWNQNHRSSHNDDRIMRRGDDRTIDSQNWGSQSPERNSYRTDDYPTDKDMNRGGQFGGRSNHQQNQSMDRSNNGSSYGWSNDYRSSQDYRPSQEQESRWNGSDNQGTDRSYGSGMSNFGSSTSDSLRGGSFGSSSYGSGSQQSQGSQGSNYAGNSSGVGSSNYGAGFYGSSSSYGAGLGTGSYSGSFGSGTSQSQSQTQGQHYGKGPKNYRRSDDRLKEDVSDALERHAHIDASEIELDVKDGVVTLRGHVEDRQTKRLAEDSVAGLYGIKDVRNELTVDQSIFTQARNAIFGETAESQSSSSTNSNRSTTKSKH